MDSRARSAVMSARDTELSLQQWSTSSTMLICFMVLSQSSVHLQRSAKLFSVSQEES
jgi:hypothetical protein